MASSLLNCGILSHNGLLIAPEVREQKIVPPMDTRGNDEPSPRFKSNLDKHHIGEISVVSEGF